MTEELMQLTHQKTVLSQFYKVIRGGESPSIIQSQMQKYKTEPRKNYMSLSDIAQDFTDEYLIQKVKKENLFKNQMTLMKEIDKRDFLSDHEYFELLAECNGN